MSRRTASRALLAAAIAVSLTACGSEDEPGSTSGAAEQVSTDLGEKPEVPASDDPAPSELVIEDVVVGDGDEAVEGSTASVQYVGAFYETGEEFDSSWNGDEPGSPLPVPVGQGLVIQGFDEALEGMQVGGRRMVTIPSELGYGEQDRGPIPGGSTLVFVLDLVEVG